MIYCTGSSIKTKGMCSISMSDLIWLEGGTITSPKGFLAGATYSGIRSYTPDKLDLGIVYSTVPSNVAGTFTTNKIKSPSVVLDQERVSSGRAQAIVINSGIANTSVGNQGMKDAIEMAAIAGDKLGIDASLVLPSSTGLIGVELPMALIRSGVQHIELSDNGGNALARAIQTTDTKSKEAAISFEVGDNTYTVGGIAKGSGMIHPNMATMLAFMTTDAPVDVGLLRKSLSSVVDSSFNMITVDGDTSTNDSVIILANGTAGGDPIKEGSPGAGPFLEALKKLSIYLAKEIASDGEGATKLIEVTIEGAKTNYDARSAARSVASSTLVKSAIHGGDPNWGRIIVAPGYSDAEVIEEKIALYINDVCIMEEGRPIPFFKEAIVAIMSQSEVNLKLDLNIGEESATAWGCDLSEEYVTFNSEYST